MRDLDAQPRVRDIDTSVVATLPHVAHCDRHVAPIRGACDRLAKALAAGVYIGILFW